MPAGLSSMSSSAPQMISLSVTRPTRGKREFSPEYVSIGHLLLPPAWACSLSMGHLTSKKPMRSFALRLVYRQLGRQKAYEDFCPPGRVCLMAIRPAKCHGFCPQGFFCSGHSNRRKPMRSSAPEFATGNWAGKRTMTGSAPTRSQVFLPAV